MFLNLRKNYSGGKSNAYKEQQSQFRPVQVAMERKGWSIYQLQKHGDQEILKESTFFTMFQKNSAPKLEYIAEISRVLGVSQAELIEPESSINQLTPLQLRILDEFKDLDDKTVEKVLPMVKGLIFAEKNQNN